MGMNLFFGFIESLRASEGQAGRPPYFGSGTGVSPVVLATSNIER